MDERKPNSHGEWDPYRVWQILLHRHPVRVVDVSGSCGHIERELRAEFCEAIGDYPDFLQDALLLIAHAEGVEAAARALDGAVREAHAESMAQTGQDNAPVRSG